MLAETLEREGDPLAEVDFLACDFKDDPFGVYARMIAEHPIFYSKRYRQHFAFSAEAVRQVMVSRDFTVSSPFRASRVLFGPTVVDIDGEDHRRLRIALSEAINVRKNQTYREWIVRPTIERVADGLEEGRRQDWVEEFCDVIPLSVMSRIIGIPDEDFAFFRRICGPIIAYLDFATADTKRAGRAAMAELAPYLEALLKRPSRADRFDDSIIGSYLDQQRRLGQPSTTEIVRHVSLLIPAAIDTTNRLIANCIHVLCSNPTLQARLREEPAGIPSFVSEVLRFEPPIHTTLRFASVDTAVLNHAIPAGAAVTVNIGAVGRDPSLFKRPDCFDPTRSPSKHVLSFGAGKHQCVGKNLATIEVCDCVEILLRRFEDIAFAPDTERPRITGTAFRSPLTLPIVAKRSAAEGRTRS